MKIAIHNRKGSFSEKWIFYCESKGIPYKIVNAFSDDLMCQLDDCDAFMWHYHHNIKSDSIIAQKILNSVEQSGKAVFPNHRTAWHFDDKLGQKYLLEGIHAPIVRTYAFYDKDSANKWLENVSFPKVFKLRGGAGSSNVRLVKSKGDAKKLIKKSFDKGFKELDIVETLKYQWNKYRTGRITMRNMFNFSVVTIWHYLVGVNNREHGYVYFQDFIPGNTFDLRIVVVGEKAFGIKRMCRDNDFRASGSGKLIYDHMEIDERCIKMSFEVAARLETQCIGFDWVFDKDGNPFIIEMSYGFTPEAYLKCDGFWTSDLEWHPGAGFDFCGWMVEDIIANVGR